MPLHAERCARTLITADAADARACVYADMALRCRFADDFRYAYATMLIFSPPLCCRYAMIRDDVFFAALRFSDTA